MMTVEEDPVASGLGDLFACQVCGVPALLPCPGCGALYFCSAAHLDARCRIGHDAEECNRMRGQVLRGSHLLEPPLPGWPEPDRMRAWLQELLLLTDGDTVGLLQRLCSISKYEEHEMGGWESLQVLQPPPSLPHDSRSWLSAWGRALPCELIPQWALLDGAGQQNVPVLHNWKEYYAARSIPAASPAALVMSMPLTLWYCLVQLLPQHGWPLPPAGVPIHIILLGPRSEIEQLPVLSELLLLLPGRHLHIHMIGPDVPDALHGRTTRTECCSSDGAAPGGSLTVNLWSGCFHELWQGWVHQGSSSSSSSSSSGRVAAATQVCSNSGENEGWQAAELLPPARPHLVLALNAGLPAAPSWMPTLKQLLLLADNALMCPAAALAGGVQQQQQQHDQGLPILFSDYNEEAAVRSQQLALQACGRGFTLGPTLNPWRQPMPASGHGTALPSCASAYLFGWL